MPVRSVRLRVIGGSVELRDDIPRTRGDCPTVTREKPCPHLKCRHHLYLTVGEDRPGRRFKDVDMNLTATMRPFFLEWPLPPSCALDVIERSERTPIAQDDMARALGIRPSGFRYLLAKTVVKLRASGIDHRALMQAEPDQTRWGRAEGTSRTRGI